MTEPNRHHWPLYQTILLYGAGAGLLVIVVNLMRALWFTGTPGSEIAFLGIGGFGLIAGLLIGRDRRQVRELALTRSSADTVDGYSSAVNGVETRPALQASSAAELRHRYGLSDRELEVLEHLMSGGTNRDLADRLHVSENTIKTHLASIYSKMNVSRRSAAIARAHKFGLTPKP